MALALDMITLGVPRVAAARDFYTAALSTTAADNNDIPRLDLHRTGQIALSPIDAATNPTPQSFPGYVLSTIVNQPAEVKTLLGTAISQGATVIKPPKKQFFGDFSAVYQAPDGAVWKVSANSKKDSGVVSGPPKPIETAIFLGVAAPKKSKLFYEALGMTADHDYGDKFVDFTVSGGVCRLGLLPSKALAKDAGMPGPRSEVPTLVLTHIAASSQDVDALLTAVTAAGGRITAPAARTDRGAYTGHFTDPDGYRWAITTESTAR